MRQTSLLGSVLAIASFSSIPLFPQSASPPQHVGAPPERYVVRISVNLVQVDATVTDSKGRPVADLKPEDIEILQDGVVQKIAHLSHVAAEKPAAAPSSQGQSNPATPVLPTRPLKPDEVRRTVALVVDDLGLSFESVAYVRRALKKFVDEQMQTGDLVAIVRTGAGMGALQQFTTDKRLLYAAIDQVRFRFMSRVGLYSFAPIIGGSSTRRDGSPTRVGNSTTDLNACSLDNVTTVGSLGALRFVVNGLGRLPGRKVLVLFSESMKLVDFDNRECDYSQVVENLRKLTDTTQRAGVVIYTVDPRGLQVLQPTAADDPLKADPDPTLLPPNATSRLSEAKTKLRNSYFDAQQGLKYLADETGGVFASHNDIAGAISDAVADAGDFYLIAYHPPPNTFDPTKVARFHRITVRLKRPGLRVRSRKGFFGVPGEGPVPLPSTFAQEMAQAVASPFTASDIHVRLTAFLADAFPAAITGLLYIDPSDLSFTRQSDGDYHGAVEATTFTFNVDGYAVGGYWQNYGIEFHPQDYERVLKTGFVLRVQQPASSGAYQMHVVVRDQSSGKIGSAHQFVEVPKLKKGALAVSGIMLGEDDAKLGASSQPIALSVVEDPNSNDAVRVFHAGARLHWACDVFDRRKHSSTGLTTKVHLFRDNDEIFEGHETRLQGPANGKDAIHASGQLQLGRAFQAGNYVLQVVVTDVADKRPRVASQWIDFEVKE